MALPIPRDHRWIATRSGEQFWPLDIRPDDFDCWTIEDVAYSLGNTCRFRGFGSRFYSVAEHSVLMAEMAPPGFRKEALMHDSPEGASPFGDVSGPVKDAFPFVHEIEDKIGAGLAKHFHFQYPPGPEVKELDHRILLDEALALFGQDGAKWPCFKPGDEPLGVRIIGLHPAAAARRFLEVWEEVKGERGLADELRIAGRAAE